MLAMLAAEVARVSLPSAKILHEIFEKQVDARPQAVAVVFGREEVTYAELDRRANRLARHLRARGVERGSIVAMLLPRSVAAYAALLGILKAGAAYVPIDPEYPVDRVTYILEDCGAAALVTSADLAAHHAAYGGAIVRVDADREAIAAEDPARLPSDEVGVDPGDLCYVIYTSGSTGRPKGVMIEHHSACHLVRAEGRIYGVLPEDRVYQGASLSFDLSVEEIWLAFHAGATLVAATSGMTNAGPDLSRHLTERGVTVLSSVPTLLSMLADDVPTLRLLIFGGEACPDRLVERWARPGRRLVNTYGPTETTVIATYADLHPGKPVTIGRAVPGYRVYLLDDELRPVPRGEIGEICIGGAGVARGYVGLPEQTHARFVPDPFAPADETNARMYRSGDRGRMNGEGTIEFCGRGDSQVKIRGFRVELAEIESALAQGDGVFAAACAVREDMPGVQQLVGYVVPREGARVNEELLRAHLQSRLPAYMTPALIETVAELPRLPSGKLDRAALPPPRPRTAATKRPGRRPLSGTERRVAEVWEALFPPQPVAIDDDFFLDLGGHSLLAARLVSELRKDSRFARISVADIYKYPTIARLSRACDVAELRSATSSSATPRAGRTIERPGDRERHLLAGVLQSGGLYFVYGLRALQWVTPYLVLFFLLLVEELPLLECAAWAALAAMAVFPASILVVVAAKWLVLGRIQPGRHPLWGGYYLRWWLVQNLVTSLNLNYLEGTPLLPLVYRLFGARIGKDVFIATHDLAAFDLISIGDGASVEEGAALHGCAVEDGELIVGPVTVGRGCFVGTRSILREGSVMGNGARLDDLSLLPAGALIPPGETWSGSPARRSARQGHVPAPPPALSPLRRAVTLARYAFLVLALPLLLFAAIVPGMLLLIHIDPVARPLLYVAAAPLAGASFVLLLTAEVVLVKWLLVGRVRPGSYPVHGGFYVKNWIVDQLLAMSLGLIGPIYATLYVAPWYRALGARIGRCVELSTAISTAPDLLEIADGGTVADEASLGTPHVEGGWMTVAPTRLGRRAFIGNSGVLPTGTAIGEGSLVGVLSIAPPKAEEAARSGASWMGSPPIFLPRRQASAWFTEARTYNPPRELRIARGAFEILRVTLPPSGFIIVSATVVTAALTLWDRFGFEAALLLLPLVYMACCAGVLGVVAAAKWLIVGRYRPFERPLWSLFVWRLELVNALYEFLAAPLALHALRGTPLLPWYLRLLGVRIGRRVYVNTTGFLEWDLVRIGDRAALNDHCVLQTHLFEDRILKCSRLHIEADCTVGARSVVLYDSKMEAGAQLNAVSLLMKGETLPAGTRWEGSPAAPSTRAVPVRAGSAPAKRRYVDDGRPAWVPA